ncbi:MAG: FtsQ-type POTRA domain-containing protein, partial [Patescibacteria group bacterium]|nr:FtsQ-type POTRA domain-containing protein [Patescibacteria group bacterium]
MFLGQTFQVKYIFLDIENSHTTITEEELNFSLLDTVLMHNILLTDPEEIIENVKNEFFYVKHVGIDRIFPDTMVINIEDYKDKAIIQHNNEGTIEEYIMNEAGVVSRAKDKEYTHLLRVQITDTLPKLEQQIATEKEIEYINGIENSIRKKLIKAISFIKVLRVEQEAHVL